LTQSILVMARVKIFWPGLGRVSHLWFGFGLGNFPLEMSIFQFITFGSIKIKSTQVKDGLSSYFLRIKSMLRSGQGPSLVHTCKFKLKISLPGLQFTQLSSDWLLSGQTHLYLVRDRTYEPLITFFILRCSNCAIVTLIFLTINNKSTI